MKGAFFVVALFLMITAGGTPASEESQSDKLAIAVEELVYAHPNAPVPFQVGASSADVADYPFAVYLVETALLFGPGDVYLDAIQLSYCSGALIDETTVATAAHCVEDGIYEQDEWYGTLVHTYLAIQGADNLRAFMDGGDLPAEAQAAYASAAVVAPSWTGNFPDSDLGFLTLADPISIAQYAALEGDGVPFVLSSEALEGQYATIASFGSTDDPRANAVLGTLQESRHRIVSDSVCTDRFFYDGDLTHLLCVDASRSGSVCGGDSGGPMMVQRGSQWIIVAVVSSGSGTCYIDDLSLGARVAPILGYDEPDGIGAFFGEAREVNAAYGGRYATIPLEVEAGETVTIWSDDKQVSSTARRDASEWRIRMGSNVFDTHIVEVMTESGPEYSQFTLEVREPQVEISIGRDRNGYPQLEGTVVDQHGDPMERVRLAMTLDDGERPRNLRGRTDADGEFTSRLSRAGPGEYDLSISIAENTRTLSGALDMDTGFVLEAEATTIVIDAIEEIRGRTYVYGTLLDEGGDPVPRQRLKATAELDGRERSWSIRTDREGSFRWVPRAEGELDVLFTYAGDDRRLLDGSTLEETLVV